MTSTTRSPAVGVSTMLILESDLIRLCFIISCASSEERTVGKLFAQGVGTDQKNRTDNTLEQPGRG